MLSYAINDPKKPAWCIYPNQQYKIDLNNSCVANKGILLNTISTSSPTYLNILHAWSLLDFPIAAPKFAHDHFFAVFAKRFVLTNYPDYQGEMLADLMKQAAEQHLNYLELMIKPDQSSSSNSSDGFASQYLTNFPASPNADDVKKAINILHNNDFANKVVTINIVNPVKNMILAANKILHCDTAQAVAACQVIVKFQYEAIRTEPLNIVFANLYAGFLATTMDRENFVGVNLVAPEDNSTSLKEYIPQMTVISYLQQLIGATNGHIPVSLHAGELTGNFVTNDDLKDHIYNALTIAKADRIGHGVDVRSEVSAGHDIFKIMKDSNKLVEINLTSNEAILGVCDGEPYCVARSLSDLATRSISS